MIRLPRRKTNLFFAMVFGTLAVVLLLASPDLALCAGSFGLLALWLYIDAGATKRREMQRAAEFLRKQDELRARLESESDTAKRGKIATALWQRDKLYWQGYTEKQMDIFTELE